MEKNFSSQGVEEAGAIDLPCWVGRRKIVGVLHSPSTGRYTGNEPLFPSYPQAFIDFSGFFRAYCLRFTYAPCQWWLRKWWM